MHLPAVAFVAVPYSILRADHFRNYKTKLELLERGNASSTSHKKCNSQRLPAGFAIVADETQTNREEILLAEKPKIRKN